MVGEFVLPNLLPGGSNDYEGVEGDYQNPKKKVIEREQIQDGGLPGLHVKVPEGAKNEPQQDRDADVLLGDTSSFRGNFTIHYESPHGWDFSLRCGLE